MAGQLEKSILATVAYFDVFDYPLTTFELARLLLARSQGQHSLADVQKTLDEGLLLQRAIRRAHGFCCARGRESLRARRHSRFLFAQEKYKQASWVMRALAAMPYVRALFVCNSLALENTAEASDVDLVVITEQGGVWWARLFCLLFLSLLGRRPGLRSRKAKICLSVFVDEARLNLAHLRMGENDIDFAYWVANFYPIYDASDVYERLWAANRAWLLRTLPNARPIIAHPLRVIQNRRMASRALEPLLAPFSAAARAIQQWKFPAAIRDVANRDTRVRIEDGLLKFHVTDRRVEHLESFVKRYEALLAL